MSPEDILRACSLLAEQALSSLSKIELTLSQSALTLSQIDKTYQEKIQQRRKAREAAHANLPAIPAPLPVPEVFSPGEVVSVVRVEEAPKSLDSRPDDHPAIFYPPGDAEQVKLVQYLPQVSLLEGKCMSEERFPTATYSLTLTTKAVMASVAKVRGYIGGFPFDPGGLVECLFLCW